MEELRFPWNGREGLIYGGVIALITGFLMMTFNICKNNGGIEAECLRESLITLPLLWVVIMLLMTFIVGKVANRILDWVMLPSDSANTRIVLNIVACVTMMSVIMTAVGPLVGGLMGGQLVLEGLYNWPQNWPVNFCVAFWIEMAVAQPAARAIMKRMHIRTLKRRNTGGVGSE